MRETNAGVEGIASTTQQVEAPTPITDHGPAARASPGDKLEMLDVGHYSRPTESQLVF